MLIEPSCRADGAPLGVPEGRRAFLGFVEAPRSPEVASNGQSALRVTGWLVTDPGRPLRLATRVGDADWVDHPIDVDRPDVIAALAPEYASSSPRCGFSFPLELPPVTEGAPLAVVLRVTDGELASETSITVRHTDEPPPRRSDYKGVWQSVSGDADNAKVAVLGSTDESYYEVTARETLSRMEAAVGVHPSDTVLEIGAGVGRIGALLAPRCGRWIGTDVSANMLGHARERCAGLDNIELVEVSGWDLAPVPDDTVDLVYCTVVFMHLDEWDRFAYVREAARVLRPGGRLYIDNLNLQSQPGWEVFESVLALHPLERPPNVSKLSTGEELRAYLERAGFIDVAVEAPVDKWWVAAHGVVATA